MLGVALSIALSAPASARTPSRLGGQVVVNSFVSGSQTQPSAASTGASGAVVVWQFRDGNRVGIRMRNLDADGVPTGPERQVNRVGDNSGVAGLADGTFFVIWDEIIGDREGVFARRFAPGGADGTSPFRASLQLIDDLGGGRITALSDGTFLVAWRLGPNLDDRFDSQLFARRFRSTGRPLGATVLVAEEDLPSRPGLAALEDGRSVLVWLQRAGTSASEIKAQRLSETGGTLGRPVPISDKSVSAAEFQTAPRIAALADGGFVVLWNSIQGGVFRGILGQKVGRQGRRIGSNFLISRPGKAKSLTAVVGLADGGFLAVWNSRRTPNAPENDVVGRRFDADGAGSGKEFRVNASATSSHANATLVTLPGSRVAVIWEAGTFADPTEIDIVRQVFVIR